MPKICYINKRFNPLSEALLERSTVIIEEYAAQGFDLTVRQVYYQFVARDWLPESWADPLTGSKNNMKSYGKLQSLLSEGRLAGVLDWEAIVDRTRNVQRNSHWDSPQSIVKDCAKAFQVDKWELQHYRPEVWIEKDALVGVISGICSELDVPYFSCRGYTSQSEMWRGAQRFIKSSRMVQVPIVIHLGDHDPSGLDMTRDIVDRLSLFSGEQMEVHRIALNRDQIDKFDPPPNPAKLSDTRAKAYVAEFGYESWELDALEPQVLVDLIDQTVRSFRDEELWEEHCQEEQDCIDRLVEVSDRWDEFFE